MVTLIPDEFMTNAVARTRHTVRIVAPRLRIVSTRDANVFRSPRPGRVNEEISAARKIAVPGVEASGSLNVTPGSPGQANDRSPWRSSGTRGPRLQRRTITDMRRYGSHARSVASPESFIAESCGPAAGPAAGVPSRGLPAADGKSHVLRGDQTLRKSHRPARVTMPERIPAVHGPLNCEMRSCVTDMSSPATRRAGNISQVRFHPHSTMQSQKGTMRESRGTWWPMILPRVTASIPLTPAATATGIPAAANATGALLARRQRIAAARASKPRLTRMAAEIATGVPNPAAPSRNAPKANAMNSAWRRRSLVMDASDLRITSNCPEATASEWTQSAETTIQQMGKSPVAAPSRPAERPCPAGIPQPVTATRNAAAAALAAGTQPGRRPHARRPKSTASGMAAARADRPRLPRGAMAGVNGMVEE